MTKSLIIMIHSFLTNVRQLLMCIYMYNLLIKSISNISDNH